jgi:hypothetical protein
LINRWEGVMGTCDYCGNRFPLTRSTRKYCTSRCKTNACLTRKPSRLKAESVRALFDLLDDEVGSAEVMRERLRAIIAPHRPPFTGGYIPRLD